MNLWSKQCLIALLLATISVWLHAETVIIDPQAGRIDLSERMALLRDPKRHLPYQEVINRLDDFKPATRRELVTGFNPGAFWLRVTLENAGTQALTRWLVVGTAKTQRVTLHLQQGEVWQVTHSGRSVARQDKPLIALDPVFPVSLMPGERRNVLLRIDSRGATDMATTLWDPHVYRHAVGERLMPLTALLGGLLVSSALALIVFARVRETQYLWLGLLLIAIAGLEASRENLLGTYFWPAHLPLPPQVLVLFAVTALFSLAKVVAHALDPARWLPAADRLLQVLRWLAVAGALIALVSYGHGVRVLSLVTIALHLATLALSLLAWRRGHTAARTFLLAFTLALLTETARQFANLGLLPWIAAMDFSTLFFLLASPLILLGLAEQTRQLTERLVVAEHLQQAKSAFLARISHELRAPLNTILGFNRMLARRSAKLSLREGTAGIEHSTLRLLRLIDELLDQARAAAGQLSIAPAPMSLQPWLDALSTSAKMSSETQGNLLVCRFSGALPRLIEADGERLRQVLENLLSNANRHTRQGTIGFDCAVTVAGQAARLDFAVHDDGEGIEAGRLQRIFEPFERGAAASSGHGLGLSICRELIRQMGSDIAVTSTPNKGSRFSFTLLCPIVDTADPIDPDTPDDLFRHAVPVLTTGRPRILLVDDDPVQLRLLTDLLEEAGFASDTACGGRAASARLDQADWNAIITDQMMPEIDGWLLLRQARALKPGLPVILLSAMKPCRPDGFPLDMHFDAALLKPASSEEVLATVWCLILKVDAGGTVLTGESGQWESIAWKTLAQLASEGDVSGIEEWIAHGRTSAPGYEHAWCWIESQLQRLNFSLLERFAQIAQTHDQRPV